jgi:hypothetical protein
MFRSVEEADQLRAQPRFHSPDSATVRAAWPQKRQSPARASNLTGLCPPESLNGGGKDGQRKGNPVDPNPSTVSPTRRFELGWKESEAGCGQRGRDCGNRGLGAIPRRGPLPAGSPRRVFPIFPDIHRPRLLDGLARPSSSCCADSTGDLIAAPQFPESTRAATPSGRNGR